jgi:hypothetical protein
VSQRWHVAQYNIAWLKTLPLEHAANADFVANLESINALGDHSPGFVWRYHTEGSDNSTSLRVRDDPRILVNFTVWESVEALHAYAFRSEHAEVYRRRREWFEHAEEPFAVIWWIPAGHVPTVEEAEGRLAHLAEHGPTAHAFTFKRRFPPPDDGASA